MKLVSTRPPMVVAISISESPDMTVFGLSSGHLEDTMYEIAMHLLANGANLAYGGDLRRGGFTELLSELIYRYRSGTGANGRGNVTDYLAWPVHINMTTDDLDNTISNLRHMHLRLMGPRGEEMSITERQKISPREPNKSEWAEGLTAMRKRMCAETDARVVLGGRVQNYKGSMPGVAEEVLLSLESHRPVFLIGGFGGCTRDMAETLGLVDAWDGSRPAWPGRDRLKCYGAEDLRNGLSVEENRTLAVSPHIDQIVALVLRGVYRLRRKRDGGDQG